MNNNFSSIFETALEFAIEKHKGQYRKKSKAPYVWHVINVAKNVEENKKSKNLEVLLVSALLHDTVEDCGVTLLEISEKFGLKVASIVEELTSDENEIKKVGKTEYLKNKMLNISSYALVIKLSDRLDNVKDLKDMDDTFRNKYKKETMEIMQALSVGRKLSNTHHVLINKINKILYEF
jgi:(p)ppGpp synthase/HD superfamily hydrolase